MYNYKLQRVQVKRNRSGCIILGTNCINILFKLYHLKISYTVIFYARQINYGVQVNRVVLYFFMSDQPSPGSN